jgi:hypothetical protein
MIQLPLPSAPVRLLLHEQWHADVQPALFPDLHAAETVIDGGDLLDRSAGRIWLRLELTALAAALRSRPERGRHAAAAACFRQRRYRTATPAERTRETRLDLVEGLAEYSGWRLSGCADGELAEWLESPPPGSWIRSFAYRTGPAYGFLLDELVPDWRRRISGELGLSTMLLPGTDISTETIGPEYGLAEITREESIRDREQADRLALLRGRYDAGRVLRLRPGQLKLSFDPNRLTQLPIGTVRGGLSWRSEDGARLTAEEGLITVDWSEIHLFLGDSDVPTSGPGWDLVLPPQWRVEPDSRGWLVRPPA